MRKALFFAAMTALLTSTSTIDAQTAIIASGPAAKAGINISDYGEEMDLVNEDFSKFNTGTETAPDFNTNINTEYDDAVLPYFENVKNEYTAQPRWGAGYAYPAGGCVCLYSTDQYDAAHINTPYFDASAHGGVFMVRFRARLMENVTDYSGIGVRILDFSEDQENGNYRVMTTVKNITNEWRTFELVVYGGSKRMNVNFCEESQVKLLLDDIKIVQIDQYVQTPNVLPHQSYTGTSFRPNWNKVDGAEKYSINVYNSDEYGTIGSAIVEDMQTTDTICTVRGLVPGNIYRYNVTAIAGTHRSLPSANIELYDLAVPAFNEVTDLKDGQFTASWAKVPQALYYNYYLYKETKAQQDGELTIIDENFDNVTDWGGENQTWEAGELPEEVTEQERGYPVGLNMTGWTATQWVPLAAGYIGVDGWHYFYDKKDNVKDPELTYDIKKYAKLETPELDLSKNEGKFTVSADLFGSLADDDSDKEHNYPKYQVNGIIALYNYDFVTGEYKQVEAQHFDLKEAWTACNAEFTKGSENSKIAIYATDGPGFLFIDNLKVKQFYQKDETFSAPCFERPGLELTYLVVPLSNDYESYNYYQRVQAVTEREVYWGTRSYTLFSRLSDPDLVYSAPTAIGSAKADTETVTARAAGDDIVVDGANGHSVEIYNAAGACVAKATAHTNSVALPAAKHGIYMVKVGGKCIKIAK